MASSCRVIRATRYTIILFTLVLISERSEGWNLPGNLFLWKFAVWRSRAFLTAPRWKVNGNQMYGQQETLFEASWPESSNYQITPLTYRNQSSNKSLDDCSRSATGLQVDGKGRMWVLEVPDKADCFARVVLYDLKRRNQMVLSTHLTNVPTKDLRSLVVDQTGSTAYIGDPGDEHILIFSLERHKWWTIRLTHGPDTPRVYTMDIALCRKSSTLYVSRPNSLDLFTINLKELENRVHQSPFNYEPRKVSASWQGTKMGYSSGLFCDTKGGLHYFMTSEKASVRWDTKLPLKAESHAVLLQNETYPCITDYTMDSQRNVWGLVNAKCSLSKKSSPKSLRLKSRTVKILKHPRNNSLGVTMSQNIVRDLQSDTGGYLSTHAGFARSYNYDWSSGDPEKTSGQCSKFEKHELLQ